MAGAGQRAGPPPPAPLVHRRHGRPPAVCAGRAGAAPGVGRLWGGVSFPQGRWGAAARGARLVRGLTAAGIEQCQCSPCTVPRWWQLLTGSSSQRIWGWAAWGLCQHGAAPLGSHCPSQGTEAIWGDLHPPMPFMPGLCGDARATLVGQRDTFLCTQATVPSSLGCSGKRSLATWGARGEPSVSLLPQAIPPALHPACATGAAKPSALLPAAARGRQRLPTGMTRGHDRGSGWAQLQGCSRSHWGWGGFWSMGCHPGVAAGLLQLQGVREVRSDRGCRGVSATSLNPLALGPGGCCHVL